MEDWNLRKSLKVEIFTAYFWLQASQSYVEFWLQLNTFFTWNMLTREELQLLCLHQIIFTNVVITIQSYWKHQTRFLWMNERRGLFCSLQWIYTFLSKTVKAQLDYKPYINDSFCVEEVRELCLVITKDHFFFRLHTCLASLGCGKHFASKFFIWHHIFVLASFRREKLSKFSQF